MLSRGAERRDALAWLWFGCAGGRHRRRLALCTAFFVVLSLRLRRASLMGIGIVEHEYPGRIGARPGLSDARFRTLHSKPLENGRTDGHVGTYHLLLTARCRNNIYP